MPKQSESYLKKIDKLLPYPKEQKKTLINDLKMDLLEAMEDSKENNPIKVFGRPRDVANSLARSKSWDILPAGFMRRSIAYFIDFSISFFLGFILFLLLTDFVQYLSPNFLSTTHPTYLALTIFITFMSIPLYVFFFYPTFVEGLFSTSIGKKICGLWIVDDIGIKITWQQSLIRSLTKLFPLLLIFESIIGYKQNKNHQRVMDTIARTTVIKISKVDAITLYLLQIKHYIPLNQKLFISALKDFEISIQEAMIDANEKNPSILFGNPRDAARNVIQSINLNTKKINFGGRIIPYLIDFFISFLLGLGLMLISIAFFQFFDPNFFMYADNLFKLFIFLAVVSIPVYSIVFYPILLEGMFSKTIGKALFKQWVVDKDGLKITWQQAVIRSLPKIFPPLLLFEIFYSYKKKNCIQRPLEVIADTKVIKIG